MNIRNRIINHREHRAHREEKTIKFKVSLCDLCVHCGLKYAPCSDGPVQAGTSNKITYLLK